MDNPTEEAVQRVRQGEVRWIDFGPPRGSAPAGRRPCVVVQSDRFNATGLATTIVCAVTSNLIRSGVPGNVTLGAGEAGLDRPSVVLVSQLMTVNKWELQERIGRLSAGRVDEINAGIATVTRRVALR